MKGIQGFQKKDQDARKETTELENEAQAARKELEKNRRRSKPLERC